MASVKNFYGKRTHHRFLLDAVNQIQGDDPKSADLAIRVPTAGGQYSGLENEDYEILNTTGLPEETLEKLKSSTSETVKLKQ